ncbi:hypothetical protein QUF64_09130 [Anaerolineales bacterium HSG6]|nr:hypothetical protein [Anaerolineales bacterium HSG6]
MTNNKTTNQGHRLVEQYVAYAEQYDQPTAKAYKALNTNYATQITQHELRNTNYEL